MLYILTLKAAAERISYLETRLEYEELETDGSHAVQSMGGIQAGSGSFSFSKYHPFQFNITRFFTLINLMFIISLGTADELHMLLKSAEEDLHAARASESTWHARSEAAVACSSADAAALAAQTAEVARITRELNVDVNVLEIKRLKLELMSTQDELETVTGASFAWAVKEDAHVAALSSAEQLRSRLAGRLAAAEEEIARSRAEYKVRFYLFIHWTFD